MRFILYLILLGTFAGWPLQKLQAQQDTRQQIATLLSVQSGAWNKGDLQTFMGTYWQSDSLLFIGKNGITYGWQATLDRYKKSYPDTTAMGKLDFKLLECKPLSKDVCLVIGRWHLERSIGDLQGHFSLVLKKINGVWKIIADHSS
ncbi:YybH family protein [Chitinophaga nivalis]|uniref:Nuclear transport factor 2 family protein n=1 Tax=Chitinophaga nivalis TaxID=2991709 RepID=A0ABT3IVE9_9BACT|nr:nuclear transport factor 2 family protein [Chitinophaga nivalis]MCW3462369.1 nuclear transport factor 2 family protein [Chitinophaga nivalis]MCW3487940.1 nuclear transport factor 2 family protein [Chitinophaga nivalis]